MYFILLLLAISKLDHTKAQPLVEKITSHSNHLKELDRLLTDIYRVIAHTQLFVITQFEEILP